MHRSTIPLKPESAISNRIEVPIEPLAEGIANVLADLIDGVVRGHMFIAAARGFGHFPQPPEPRRHRKKPLCRNASDLPLNLDQPTHPAKAL